MEWCGEGSIWGIKSAPIEAKNARKVLLLNQVKLQKGKLGSEQQK